MPSYLAGVQRRRPGTRPGQPPCSGTGETLTLKTLVPTTLNPEAPPVTPTA